MLGKNDITHGQANSNSVPPDQEVNKAEELTCHSINIDHMARNWFRNDCFIA
jgi:hypothetical protein